MNFFTFRGIQQNKLFTEEHSTYSIYKTKMNRMNSLLYLVYLSKYQSKSYSNQDNIKYHAESKRQYSLHDINLSKSSQLKCTKKKTIKRESMSNLFLTFFPFLKYIYVEYQSFYIVYLPITYPSASSANSTKLLASKFSSKQVLRLYNVTGGMKESYLMNSWNGSPGKLIWGKVSTLIKIKF